jgi:hypothetical protein
LRASDLREVKFCLGNCPSTLEGDNISAATGDVASQSFNMFAAFRGCRRGGSKTVAEGIPAGPFPTST